MVELLLIFFSQLVVYPVYWILRKPIHRWLTLGYTILNVILAFPIGFIVLFFAVMGTDSGTNEAIRTSMIFLIVSIVLYLVIFINSLIQTIKAFKQAKKALPEVAEKEKEE